MSTRERRIPPFVFVLTAAIGAVGSNSLSLGPIAPEVTARLGTDVPSVMTAGAAFGLGVAASAFLLARYIDRVGARRILLTALFLMAAALIACALAPALIVLIAGQFTAGIAAGIALPAIYSLAAAVAPPGRESETIGIVLVGWTLSTVGGVALSALIADFAGWRYVYAMIATALLAVSIPVWNAKLRDDQRSTVAAPSPFAALGVKGVPILLAGCAIFNGAFYGVYAYVGAHLHEALGLPVSANGAIAVAYGLGFGGAAFFHQFVARIRPDRLLPSSFVAMAATYLAMAAISGSYASMIGIIFIWGLANHIGFNALVTRLTGLDPARRGAIMGLNSGVSYIAMFAGTIGFGSIYAANGFAVLAMVAAGCVFTGAAVVTRTPRSAAQAA